MEKEAVAIKVPTKDPKKKDDDDKENAGDAMDVSGPEDDKTKKGEEKEEDELSEDNKADVEKKGP